MRIFRFLSVLLFFSLGCAPILAQVPQKGSSAAVQEWSAGSSEASIRSGIDQYHVQRLPYRFMLPSEGQSADVICYSIRNYLVVRDSPNSDATHAGGSYTCQPATRFRMHSVDERTLSFAP